MASVSEIRSTFLSYFERNGHKVVESSPLVPRNDPTLMFTNSGMVQFKNLFTGVEQRDYKRATTSQKCVRAGGKHNDLDNVGYTARHHTFFEMLGNFSFGDYFKEQAIAHCWDLMTKEFEVPRDRLLVTIYHDDDESASIWSRYAGLPDDRIIRIATSDNFWSMGPTGPCGPCTELYYDYGDQVPGGPPGSADEDGDRFVEIWNLVLMQFEQFEDGKRVPLPKPSIDTGMGLERVAALLQGTHDNFQTDLFRKLIEAAADVTLSDPDGPGSVHHRVIADHLRSTAFLIADGVLPSKDGRGYVLRRIMRRAMRHARQLGADEPVMHQLVPVLANEMGSAFPELVKTKRLIEDTCYNEEKRFRETLDRGLKLLDEELDRLPSGAALPGDVAFKLYDTYGFPLDLTQDALRERGRSVDSAGFEQQMSKQRERARAAWAGSGEQAEARIWFELTEKHGPSEFLGYDTESAEAQVLAILVDGRPAARVDAGGKAEIVVNQTPFYAEAGGQVGDTGRIIAPSGRADVIDTYRRAGMHVHRINVQQGHVAEGEPVSLEVDGERRRRIRGCHSATHLLHEALRQQLGEHIAQRGSLNSDGRIRFDFSHSNPLSSEELAAVEEEVNSFIKQDSEVSTRIMRPDEARSIGAQALFGEKYGDEVRVVTMGERPGSGKGADGSTYSIELCGGTHVGRTGEIGRFVAVGERASSAGIRRIEAMTGASASTYLAEQDDILVEVARLLKCRQEDIVERLTNLVNDYHGRVAVIRQNWKQMLSYAANASTSAGLAEVARLLRCRQEDVVESVRKLVNDFDGRLALMNQVRKQMSSHAANASTTSARAELAEVARLLRCRQEDVVKRVGKLVNDFDDRLAQIKQIRKQAVSHPENASTDAESLKLTNGICFSSRRLESVPGRDLAPIIDEFRSGSESGVLLLLSDSGGKAAVAAGVSKDLVGRVSAVDIVKAATPALGGKGGGGRPDFAQGGGPDAAKAGEAIEAARNYVEGLA